MTQWKRKGKKAILQEVQCPLKDGSSLPLLKYPLLEESDLVTHGFTTRMGGVSTGIYESLNLSFTRGDEDEAVRENYRRVAEALGVSVDQIVCSDQTHTTHVRRVTRKDAGHGVTKEKTFFDTDGLITNEPGLVLATFYADCVPLYFLDPVKKAIGLSHSGWRGTVHRMGAQTIKAMQQEFGSDPKDILCAIGPSICQDCYEVSADVAEKFEKEFFTQGLDRPEELLLDKKNGKYQLNLWKANEIVLREAGILKEHLQITDICTCCNPDLLFSHRESHGKRGNLAAFMALK